MFHTLEVSEAIDPVQTRTIWAQVIIDNVSERDARFQHTDVSQFTSELMSVRAELFGLAWAHAFRGKDKHLLGEGAVAKEVLTAMGLWERAQKYNKAAARSGDSVLPQSGPARLGAAAFQNKYRLDLFGKWVDQGADPEVAARAVSRIFTDDAWKKGATLRNLLAELIQVLGFGDPATETVGLNDDAVIALHWTLLDIYQGSREGIAQTNIRAD